MKVVKNKLKSENGVSILFALFLLIVVAMVSVTMISASVTAVKRTHSKKYNEQNSILLDSAALLLKDKIPIKDNIPRTVNLNNVNGVYVCSDGDYGIFANEIKQISEAICNNPKSGQASGKLIFQVNDSKLKNINVAYEIINASDTSEGNVGKVQFTLTVDGDTDVNREYVRFNLTKPSENQIVWNFDEISAKGEGDSHA